MNHKGYKKIRKGTYVLFYDGEEHVAKINDYIDYLHVPSYYIEYNKGFGMVFSTQIIKTLTKKEALVEAI